MLTFILPVISAIICAGIEYFRIKAAFGRLILLLSFSVYVWLCRLTIMITFFRTTFYFMLCTLSGAGVYFMMCV
jgi:hypothetical protein